MKDYIKIGVEKGYISFDQEMSRITYAHQNKSRSYSWKSPVRVTPEAQCR